MTNARPVAFKPVFGGFVLETLTMGMYGESINAIREYIQNSFDSIQKATRDQLRLGTESGVIRVIFDGTGQKLVIRDNGSGVSANVAAEVLTSVGASRKDYRSEAGFRGIGRLAGIAFSDTVSFRTKAAFEPQQTEVVFNGKRMRELMSPGIGSDITAEALLAECVTATATDVSAQAPSFFEVELSGLVEPPKECTQPALMALFLSQVAPVPYRDDFEWGAEIRQRGSDFGLPIEEVSVVIETPGMPPIEVRKPFKAGYEVQDAVGDVTLTEIKPYFSPNRWWWGWVGIKAEPGAYLEEEPRGIRVRAKNIQIDGASVVREIFQKRSKSTARYQDWFIGEIFVRASAVTPNARRDSFEDTTVWRAVQAEIAGTICKDAGSSAQNISNKGQLTLTALTDKAEKLTETLGALRRASFTNQDRTIALSADTTKLAAEVARATRNADAPTQAELKSLASRLLDMKSEAAGGLATSQPSPDRERIEFEARQALLGELQSAFKDNLPSACLSAVRKILRENFDFPPEA